MRSGQCMSQADGDESRLTSTVVSEGSTTAFAEDASNVVAGLGFRSVFSDVTLDFDVGLLGEDVGGVGGSRSKLAVGAVALDLHYERK